MQRGGRAAAEIDGADFAVALTDFCFRRRLGRKHGGDEAFAYLEKLCEINAVIVVDLMFGLPNQTDAVWQNDLERATALPLSGLDTYAFNLYPMLPINRMVEKGAFPAPPGFDVSGRPIRLRRRNTGAKGWNQVSNSHFAYPGRGERNRYNTLVKSNIPCWAFAPAQVATSAASAIRCRAIWIATSPRRQAKKTSPS